MTRKIKIALMMFALIIVSTVTVAAQTRHRTRSGRDVNVYRNDGRGYRNDRDDRWDNDRDRRQGRRDHRRDDDWRSNSRWRRQNHQNVFRGRTYRLPNGRIVTILPNGRRIYR